MTNTYFTSRIRTQIIGAVLGLGAGGVLYLATNQISSLSLTGLIISPNTVTENVAGVVTNSQDTDPSTLARLARQAQQVASQLNADESSSSSSVNAVVARADQRGEARASAAAAEEARANAPVYDMTNSHGVLSETERLAIRNAGMLRGAAPQQSSSKPVLLAGTKGYTVPQPQIIQRVEVPVEREVIREVIKEVPVDREVIREVIKEVPVDRQVIKEVPVDREVIKEVPVIKEVIKEVPVIKEVIKEVPVYINTATPVIKGPLTHTGPGLLLVAGSSALAAFSVLRRKKLAL